MNTDTLTPPIARQDTVATSASEPDLQTSLSQEAEKPHKPQMSKLERFAHWTMAYVVIGWVLNAFVSIHLYDWVGKRLESADRSDPNSKAARFLGFMRDLDNPGHIPANRIWHAAKQVLALGAGGFLMLPLQDVYVKCETKISNVFRRLLGKELLDEPKVEDRTNGARWLAARVLSLFTGAGGAVLIKHGFDGAGYKWLSKIGKSRAFSFVEESRKDSYLTEQLAAGSATITLWAAKTGLDKIFGPEKIAIKDKAEEQSPRPPQAKILSRGTSSHEGRAAATREQATATLSA